MSEPASPPSPAAASPQQGLADALARVARLHAERLANPILAGALERLGAWQSLRLARTYADLAAQPRYAAAVAFFRADLYGGADYAQRDADLARVVPLLRRALPARVIATIAQAMELNALSQELDRALLARLPRADGRFSVAEYCKAYRRSGNRAGRERQIALIGEVGAALDVYVTKPLIRTSLRMMRKPARVAGFGELHDFLERGFTAFARMGGAREFLATIADRESGLANAILAGDTAPFADPTEARPISSSATTEPAG
jgi:hypothetical protein